MSSPSVTKYLSLDLRALAVFRVAIGSVFLLDLLLRSRDLQMFYGDRGVLSRELFLTQSWLLSEYQPFMATGSTWGLGVVFALGAAAAICLIVGYQSRYAGLACWLFTVGLQLRNPVVLDGGDEILRLLLFWTPLLPLSARWSWDAEEHPHWKRWPNEYRSVSTVGIYLQYVVLYFFAALLKTGPDWRETGEALYYTLSIDQFATPLGQILVRYPALLQRLTPMALVLEFSLALLLLCPTWLRWPRFLFLLGAVVFHLSIFLLLDFGIFMLIAVLGLTVFLPGRWFDRMFPSSLVAETAFAGVAPPGYCLSALERAFGCFIIFYIITVNLQSVDYGKRLPGWTMAVARVTYEHQHWHLFAPIPFREDGWFIFEVTDTNGKVWRSLGDGNSDAKPALVSGQFPNQRWRRWFQNLVLEPFADTQSWRDSTARYLATAWLADHPELRIASYRLRFMEEMTPPPGQKPVVTPKVLSQSAQP